MKYDANFFLDVLSKELTYSTRSFSFGKTVEMPPMDAFRYVVFSNSGYIDLSKIEKRLIIRKDLFRIFNQAEQENIQNGVFDAVTPTFKYTPNKYFAAYPSLLEGTKYVYFMEYEGKAVNGEPSHYGQIQALHDRILQEGLNPFDFIVTLVPAKNAPKDLEPFFEYYVVERYRRKGYLTDSQLPFYYGVGTPDAGVYALAIFERELFSRWNISGASTLDLMCLRHLPRNGVVHIVEDTKAVFEVKTGSIDGSQIKKYTSKNIFDRAYEVIPHKKARSEYAGLIRFDGSTSITEEGALLPHSQEEGYIAWLITYVKCFLFANLTDGQLAEFNESKGITSTKELVAFIKTMTMEEILSII